MQSLSYPGYLYLFVQTRLGSPAGEGGLDNIIVTTHRTCLGKFEGKKKKKEKRKGEGECRHSNKELRANSTRNSLQVSAWKHGLCTKQPHM